MNPDSLFIRQMLVCASGSLYWIGVAVLAILIRRRTGKSANVSPRGVKERALWVGWTIVVVGWIVQPLLPTELFRGPLLSFTFPVNSSAGFVLGVLLAVAGQLGTYWCYWAMGDSWRIGVSRAETASLVTRGPYARVRHPIYAFQTLMLIGAACLLPTLLSALLIVLQLTCGFFKAADEESYLAEALGPRYLSYRNQTGWLWPRFLSSEA